MNVFLSSINKHKKVIDLGIYERILFYSFYSFYAKKYPEKNKKHKKNKVTPHGS